MDRKRTTVLPHLDESLEKLRDQQIRPEGQPDGLGGHNLDKRDPEIRDPHRVSNTHPFHPEGDEHDSDDEE